MQGANRDTGIRSDEPVLFNWHVGTLQPYSSLWLNMQRLSIINQISLDEVRSIAKAGNFSTQMHSLIENKNTLDIDALSAAIGEKPQCLAFSTMQAFAPWLHRYFIATSIQYCPTCLAHGFHSVFQCLKLMSHCPIHGERLEQHCPCGAPISACVSPSLYRNAGMCSKCFRQFLDISQARRPSMPMESLSAFDEVKDWLLGLGNRVSTMVAELARHRNRDVSIEAAAELATRSMCLPFPRCLVPQPIPPYAELFSALQSPRAACGPESSETRRSPKRLVFSAIDRHFRRHVLCGQKWITRLSMHSDADYIADQIACDADAFIAWAYLLWLMAVFESNSLRSLRFRDASVAYLRGINVPGCSFYGGGDWDRRTIEWLEYHAAEISLAATWRDLHQAVLSMSRDQRVRWGSNIASGAGRFQWLGIQHTNGTVEFSAAQSIGASFGYAVRPQKPHQRPTLLAPPSKLDAVLDEMPQCGLVKLQDGDWVAGALTAPIKDEHVPLRVHRLLHVDSPLHFIVIRCAGFNEYFAARLVELGLEARGADSRLAIESLRTAVRQYTRQFGAPGK